MLLFCYYTKRRSQITYFHITKYETYLTAILLKYQFNSKVNFHNCISVFQCFNYLTNLNIYLFGVYKSVFCSYIEISLCYCSLLMYKSLYHIVAYYAFFHSTLVFCMCTRILITIYATQIF